MRIWVRRLVLAAVVIAAAPFVLWWGLMHVAAAIGLLLFAGFLHLALLPLRTDLRSARARCTPRLRRRTDLSDDAVDAEFERIAEFQRLIDGASFED